MPPWTANITTVVTPTSSANGFSRAMKLIEMLPSASTGSPNRRLPNATPSRTARPADAAAKTVSHVRRQPVPSSLERNSRATVRRIRTSRTSMNARYRPENSEA